MNAGRLFSTWIGRLRSMRTERTADAAAGPVCMETQLQSYLRTGWGKAMMNSDMFS